MPIKHAALKHLRQNRTRRARNQAVQSEIRTLTKRLLGLLKEQKLDEARSLLHVVAGKYDRAAAKHVIHPNTAARYKSRLARRLNRPAPAAGA